MIIFNLLLLIVLLIGIKLFPEYIVEISLIVIGIEVLYIGLYCMIKSEVERIVRKYIIKSREE